jgi:hypothetical protein
MCQTCTYMVINYFHIGGVFIVRSIKKTIPAVIWVYAYCFVSPAIRLSTDQWLCDPPLQVVCFFPYDILGIIFWGSQTLSIT